MTYKAPITILRHPGVEECLSGDDEGMDYKHAVWLREDWRFERGRMAGCRSGNFNRVADFLYANPMRSMKEADAITLNALKLAQRVFDEALPKFNWGASALDANAIQLLNEAPAKIRAAIASLEGKPS